MSLNKRIGKRKGIRRRSSKAKETKAGGKKNEEEGEEEEVERTRGKAERTNNERRFKLFQSILKVAPCSNLFTGFEFSKKTIKPHKLIQPNMLYISKPTGQELLETS